MIPRSRTVHTKWNRAARGDEKFARSLPRAQCGRQCVTVAICNQDLYTGERNFRPDFCTFYARQQPGGKSSCHSIPKVSEANVTPAISQMLHTRSSHLWRWQKHSFSTSRRKKSSWRTRAASARDTMNGHRITLSRSIPSNPDDRRRATCISRKKHTVPNDRTSTALIFGNRVCEREREEREKEREKVKISSRSTVLTLSFSHWIVAKFRFFTTCP